MEYTKKQKKDKIKKMMKNVSKKKMQLARASALRG